MNEIIIEESNESLTIYEQACSKCIDDLYHTAYLALVNVSEAEKYVTEICVTGVHKYDDIYDEAEIRFHLTSDLYHRVKRRLWFSSPNTETLPNQLQILTKWERLIVAMHYSSGLTAEDSQRILKLSQAKYRNRIDEVMRKIRAI